MRDPELVARAQRAATRLESSWEHWRALHGLAAAPGQPVVSYVGYSLTEPWGEPRVVVGLGADEAEFLADYLDRDDCAVSAQLPVQQMLVPEQSQPPEAEFSSASLLGAPVSPGAGRSPATAGPPPPAVGLPSVAVGLSQAGAGLPHGVGLPYGAGLAHGAGLTQAGSGPEMSAEFAAWSSGELPGQASEQLASWPGMPLEQPPSGV